MANSRFITTIARVESVSDAKTFLTSIRAEMPDASHHVYAYRIGYGKSTIEGMSDDREPSGTAGPPVLAVLRGTKVGDVIVVVTRYFGGTKLGTGGLVRAYTEAAQTAFSSLKIEEKIEKSLIGVEAPYPFYEPIKRLVASYGGEIQDESFTTNATLMIEFAKVNVKGFALALSELTAGRVQIIELN